jgi:alpha-glucosidase
MEHVWWQHGVIYQIYPRSFADSNGDGIGDLNGIIGKLGYLANLGVDAIWLSPIYPSPDVDFGYDVSDYIGIDPKYGTLEDFDRLVCEAHALGIRIILDLVLNHTSDQHPWFIESRKSRENPYRDWYIWADPKAGGRGPEGRPPNNWESVFGGRGWEFDPTTGQYYFHMFYKQQPDLNWHNPAVRQAILDVFRFWLDRGVDGFRLDVFNVYFKDAGLANNPPALGLRGFDRQKHLNDCDRPELIPLLREIRALLDQYSTPGKERYMVGETFISTAQKAASYCGQELLHAAFNFEFLSFPFKPRKFSSAVERWEHILSADTWPNYVLNNHDVIRTATRWRTREDDARLKVAAAMLLTLRGTPFLYYGEEIGMRDIPIHSREEVLDPIGKRYWPIFKGRDGCRSPMQWNAAPQAGFTDCGTRPWLPVHSNHTFRNVEQQQEDPLSLYNFYCQLIRLRRTMPALCEGMFQPITFGTQYQMAYLRQTADQVVMVALNFSRFKQRLVLGNQLARAQWRLLLSTHAGSGAPNIYAGKLFLAPFEAVILSME